VTITRSDKAAVLLAAGRGAIGGAAFLMPTRGVKTFGIGSGPEGNYLVRLFAIRNMTLAGALLASHGDARRLWYKANIIVDTIDVASGLIGLVEGKPRSAAALDTRAAAVGALLGVVGLVSGGRTDKGPTA
jgi:hypothetical protein